MHKLIALTLLMMGAFSIVAANKISGTTTLKDVQPAGTTDKDHKQQYDLSFVSSTGEDYTCRTSAKKSVNATDFVVGSNVNYQVDGNKGKVKSSAGKQLSCTVVRVSNAAASPK